MKYILSYSSITLSKKKSITRFGGSSKFRVLDDEIAEKPKTQIAHQVNERTNPGDESKLKVEISKEKDKKKNQSYRINKSKVKKKCHALSRLEKSKKFLAFYTITFQVVLTDQICYRFFNTWLTRCRKSTGLKTYLWVAERQKKNTIHYHLLTNDFMQIQAVNGYMIAALTN